MMRKEGEREREKRRETTVRFYKMSIPGDEREKEAGRERKDGAQDKNIES